MTTRRSVRAALRLMCIVWPDRGTEHDDETMAISRAYERAADRRTADGEQPGRAETRRYIYDDLGRLTRAVYDTQTVLTYTYDRMDNRQTAVYLACVINGEFDGRTGWTTEGSGAITFDGTLCVVGATTGSANLTTVRQTDVPGGNEKTLTATLLSYTSADPDAEDDYPVVLLDSTTYRICTDGALQTSAANCSAVVNNAHPVTTPVALTIPLRPDRIPSGSAYRAPMATPQPVRPSSIWSTASANRSRRRRICCGRTNRSYSNPTSIVSWRGVFDEAISP